MIPLILNTCHHDKTEKYDFLTKVKIEYVTFFPYSIKTRMNFMAGRTFQNDRNILILIHILGTLN